MGHAASPPIFGLQAARAQSRVLVVGFDSQISGLVLAWLDTVLLPSWTYGGHGPLASTFIVTCAIPSFAVLVRRLHDTGRTGWWALVRIPSYGMAVAGSSAGQAYVAIRNWPGPIVIIIIVAWITAVLALFVFT